MEGLIEILTREFSKAGYMPKETKDGIIWKYETGVDYWLILEGLLNDDSQFALFDSLKSFFDEYPDAEKNMSILCVVKDSEADEETIIKIENDVNYFKKYVLKYTDDEFDEIRNLVSEKTISELVMEESIFKSLKDGHNSLLYNIAHKLPFIIMNVQSKDINELDSFASLSEDMSDLLNWVQKIDVSSNDLMTTLKQKAESYGTC